jgi:hypothetical protein
VKKAQKPQAKAQKQKCGRPKKVAEMIEGKDAANRFKKAMGFALAGGIQLTGKKP